MKAVFTLWVGEVVQILPFGGFRGVLYTSMSTNRNFNSKGSYYQINQSEQICSFSRQSEAKTEGGGVFPPLSQFLLRVLIGLTAASAVIGQMWLARFWFRDSHSKKYFG